MHARLSGGNDSTLDHIHRQRLHGQEAELLRQSQERCGCSAVASQWSFCDSASQDTDFQDATAFSPVRHISGSMSDLIVLPIIANSK